MYEELYKKVEEHVTAVFNSNAHPNLTYHNLQHTKNVVTHAHEIATHYQLGERDLFILYTAAWFHDTGHLFTGLLGHEEKSVEIMTAFMQNESSDNELINEIAGCILATHFPPSPETQLHQIICDADTYHFGTKDFRETNKRVKEELIQRNYDNMLVDWPAKTLKMLEQHTFFTPYCQALLDEGKNQNIKKLKKKLSKIDAPEEAEGIKIFEDENKDEKQDKKKGSLQEKGIQTMLRLTSSNHFKLSEMADSKAHILISVNAIIISITLTVFIKTGETDSMVLYPAIVFLVSSLTTIVISILATRPKITEGVFSKEDVQNKKTNLLFFGNFYKSSLEDYKWAMSSIMNDHQYLYSALIQDIHQLGVVLARKYKLIRLAYNIFMIGLVVSVLTFIISSLLYNQQANQVTIINGTGSPL